MFCLKLFPTQSGISRWRQAAAALAALLPCLGWGALAWKTQEIQLTATLGDKTAVAVFSFQNTGTASVTITAVQPTCTCTTAELFKWTYAPGESGEIKAVFTFGDRFGPQEKFIKVKTDGQEVPATLTFRLTIPEMLACTPRVLRWTKGAEPAEQSAVLLIAESHRISSIELMAPAPEGFALRIEPIERGKKYQLFVRPVAAGASIGTPVPLRGQARLEDGTVHPFQIIALVQ